MIENKTSLVWVGNKSRMVDMMLDYMPEHRVYIEGFAGSLAFLLNKPRSEVEMFNDADRGIVNYWECVKENPGLVIKYVKKFSRNFVVEKERHFVGLQKDRFMNAAHFVLVNRNVLFGDMVKKVPSRLMCDVDELIDRMIKNSDRLQGVSAFKGDYLYLCETFEGQAVFVFLDPPYHGFCEYNGGGFNDSDFENLAEYMRKTESKVMLTINDDEFTRETFGEFKIVEVVEGRINGGSRMNEILVMNYEV